MFKNFIYLAAKTSFFLINLLTYAEKNVRIKTNDSLHLQIFSVLEIFRNQNMLLPCYRHVFLYHSIYSCVERMGLYVLEGGVRRTECCGSEAQEPEKRQEYLSDRIQQALP